MRRSRLILLLLCLAVAAPLLATPAAADARARKAIWGPLTLPDGRSAFPTYKRLGVDVLQLSLAWSNTAPTKPANPRNPADPAYRWPAEIDRAIAEGRRNGIEILLVVGFTPGWANGGRAPFWTPNRARDFADFTRAAARRYRRVRFWQIWGEPSRQGQFMPLPADKPTGPRAYAKLLDGAYGQLKRQSRRNIVIGANTFTVGAVSPYHVTRWLRMPNGRPPRMDWWGHNPFSARYPRLRDKPVEKHSRDFSDLDTLYSDIRRVYRRTRRVPRIWISEWTIQSDAGSDQFRFFVPLNTQAKWVTQGYRVANRLPYVAGLGWYQLLDDPAGRNWGLMRADGTTRKPAYDAYRRVKGVG